MKNPLLPYLVAIMSLGVLGCSSKNDAPAPTPYPSSQPATIAIDASGPSPAYTLANGMIIEAEYDAISVLIMSGKLSDGKSIQLRFGNNPGFVAAYKTNALDVYVDGTLATISTGQSTYDNKAKKVSGKFQFTNPLTSKAVAGGFTDVPVVVR